MVSEETVNICSGFVVDGTSAGGGFVRKAKVSVTLNSIEMPILPIQIQLARK